MSARATRWAFGSCLLVAALTPAPSVAADDKLACVRASDRGQELRDAGKLRAARLDFVACARAGCPQIVRAFCTQRIEEVDAALPSVVVRARDPAGGDAVDVRVLVDGAVVTSKLDGSALTMDPGEHVFRYELAGVPAVEQRVLLRTAEKNRALDVTFAAPPRPAPAAVTAARAAPPQAQAPAPLVVTTRASPVASFVVGGVGAAALGASLLFVLAARADVDELQGRCAPGCANADLDPAREKVLAANLAAIAGGVALATAVVLYLTRPTETRTIPAVSLRARPRRAGGEAMLELRF